SPLLRTLRAGTGDLCLFHCIAAAANTGLETGHDRPPTLSSSTMLVRSLAYRREFGAQFYCDRATRACKSRLVVPAVGVDWSGGCYRPGRVRACTPPSNRLGFRYCVVFSAASSPPRIGGQGSGVHGSGRVAV